MKKSSESKVKTKITSTVVPVAAIAAILEEKAYQATVLNVMKKLKKIYKQPASSRVLGWQDEMIKLNDMMFISEDHFGLGECALATYLQQLGNINKDDIHFLNFLLDNGVSKEPLVASSTRFILYSFQHGNRDYLQWLLERCECFIVDDPDDGHPLQLIAQNPKSEWSQYFLKQLPASNLRNDTALIVSARYNFFKLVPWLIDKEGHDIDAINAAGETALLVAVKHKFELIIRVLIRKNANVALKARNGQTVFHVAMLDETSDLFRVLVSQLEQQGGVLANILTEEGYNLLQWAVIKNVYLMISEFLTSIDPLLCDPRGRNLAVLACCSPGGHELAAMLIRKHSGLNIHDVSDSGMNALHHCILAEGVSTSTMAWLINDQKIDLEAITNNGETPLLLASKHNNILFLHYFIAHFYRQTIHFKFTDRQNRHVGHYLAEFNRYELIELLFKKKLLDLAHLDNDGRTMLDVALMKGASHYPIVRLCMEYIHHRRKKKDKPLLSLKTLQQLPALLDFFCSTSFGDAELWLEDGQTPFHMACLYGQKEVLKTFVERFRLDINKPNQRGESPFYSVIKDKTLDEILWFHKTFQPKITKLDALNSTVLQVACEKQDLALVTWCVENRSFNFSILKTRKDGCNALDIALIQQHFELVSYLWNRLTAVEKTNYVGSLTPDDSDHLAYLVQHGLHVQDADSLQRELPFVESVEPSCIVDWILEVSPVQPVLLELPDTHDTIPLASVLLTCPLPDDRSSDSSSEAMSEAELREGFSGKLSASAPVWTAYPRCYLENPYLKELIDEISILFNQSVCDGYLYGSSHYKDCPGDFDILLTNIKTLDDLKQVHSLIELFIAQGGVVTTMNPLSGEWGYRKANRYVIPVAWRGFRIEFIVSKQGCAEHAQILDFTLGACYFNLKERRTHSIPGINSVLDAYRKEINTIFDPFKTFNDDLSRVFRAVRLVGEGFSLSGASEAAIRCIFSRSDNPFISNMNPNKLTQQLTVLFASRNAYQNLDVLYQLGVLVKLVECLSLRIDKAGRYYLEQIIPYYNYYMQQDAMRSAQDSSFFFAKPLFYSFFPPVGDEWIGSPAHVESQATYF